MLILMPVSGAVARKDEGFLCVIGNVLIRPPPPGSQSPYNFEVVLLDHGGSTPEIKYRSGIYGQSLGLYFDIDDELRVNYVSIQLIHEAVPDSAQSRFWLNLLSPPTERNKAERRKYAELVGNITPEQVGLRMQIDSVPC